MRTRYITLTTVLIVVSCVDTSGRTPTPGVRTIAAPLFTTSPFRAPPPAATSAVETTRTANAAVVATSSADPSKSASGSVTVSAPASSPPSGSAAGCATAPLRTSTATADHGYGAVHYFCSNGGSDSNDGSSSSTPKSSWSAVIATFNSMPAGDTVALCRGGTWTGASANIYNPACRANNTCDFRDYGSGNRPIINWSGGTWLFNLTNSAHDEGYRFWNIDLRLSGSSTAGWLLWNDVSDLDFCNINVDGGQGPHIQDQAASDPSIGRSNRIMIRNSSFSNATGEESLLLASSNTTVDSCVFTNNGSGGTVRGNHAVYFQEEDMGPRSETSGMETQNLRITNNVITLDSTAPCNSSLIHIAGRQNNGLVENNYMSAATGSTCMGIGSGSSGYGVMAWFRAMTYRRNRIFLPGNANGIALDAHGTVASDVNGQSVYTLNQAVPPAVVADNIIVTTGQYPVGINYQSPSAPGGDATSGIIAYNNSIYLPNAQSISPAVWIQTGSRYVTQNNAVYGPNAYCVYDTSGSAQLRQDHNYCRTAGFCHAGDTCSRSASLASLWTNAGAGDFSLPAGSPLIGSGSSTYYDPYAIAPSQATWTAAHPARARTAPIDVGAFSSR